MILVTFASWEERFVARLRDDVEAPPAPLVLMYHLDKYADWTEENRNAAREWLRERGSIELAERELEVRRPERNWAKLRDDLAARIARGSRVLVDFTTMPREFIWSVFWLLDMLEVKVDFVYSRPARYDTEWLSRDPQRPRLVYKMSGIADPGKRVCLLVLAGYDTERAKQLMDFYEPSVTLLGLQRGDGDQDNDKRMDENKRLAPEPNVCCFDLNAYSSDQGQRQILGSVGAYLETHNVIMMGSLGPKLSAVALYRIQREHPQAALAYAPSGEFNREYSQGVGPSFSGKL